MTVDSAGGVLLLVNDNPVQLDAMRLLLTHEGFTAHSAASAEEALAVLKGLTPELIVSDVVMPGMDGIELCRLIKSGPASADIPILLVSGLRYDDSSVAQGLEAGADDYLEADAPPSLLIKKLHRLINQARERKHRLRAEAALRESEVRFRSLVETAFDAMLIHSRGRILEASRGLADLFGYSLAELAGKSLLDLVAGESRPTVSEKIGSGVGQVYEAIGVKKDGMRFPIEVVGRDLTLGNELVRVTALRDLTREKQLEALARYNETMAAVGQLVSGVAHEVRNPLFALSSLLDAFEARFSDKTEYHRYSSRMRAEIDRLNSLMQDLLQYGTPVAPQFKQGRIDDVIARAVRSCEPLALDRSVTIARAADGPCPQVEMDRSRLTQAFINLIENAIHHSPAGGVVELETRQITARDRLWVECAIKDAGKGFEPEDLPRLFEPFFTRRRGGTGLGLAIVERIVRAHGGCVSAGNRPGGGAVVTLRLPPASAPERLK